MIVSAALLRSARELGWWAAGRRRRFRVTGTSMTPTLADGEFVLVDTSVRPRAGELALAVHPHTGRLVVKRIAEELDAGWVAVTSDNPAGTDSRSWGPLSPDRVQGRVSLILDRPMAPLSRPPADVARPAGGWARWLRR